MQGTAHGRRVAIVAGCRTPFCRAGTAFNLVSAVVVRDAPGFWVNRILAPYLNEAGWLLEEGVEVDAIDRAMTAFGFPVGPIALLDEVGLDMSARAAAVLHTALGDRLAPAPGVGRLVGDGRLGRKSGRRFYQYERGKKKVDESARDLLHQRQPMRRPSSDEVERRPILAMLNEAARAMSEGVVRCPSDADIDAVMGLGFPPYLGGPLRYIDEACAKMIVTELEHYAGRIGPRFTPAEVLVEMTRRRRTVYH